MLLLEEPPNYGLYDVARMMEVAWETQEGAVRLLESLGAKVERGHWIINAITFKAEPVIVDKLRRMGYTIIPEPVFELAVYNIEFPPISLLEDVEPTSDYKSIGANRLHALGVTGRGVKIAVIDNGIENKHPWLQRNGTSVVKWDYDATWTGIKDYCGEKILLKGSRDAIGLINSHGTHVAGIIASQGIGVGARGISGVAPGADIYDIIVFRYTAGCMYALAGDIVTGIEAALLGPDGKPDTGDEADILNLSIGRYMSPQLLVYPLEENPLLIIERALARVAAKGKLVVVAAGNSFGFYTVNTLCLADGVVCVGASNTYWWRGDSWEDDEVAKFSSRGPIPWGRIAPTLAAPGVRILSAILSDVDPLFPGAEASGTSMATPHVSGALALLIEYNRGRGAPTSPDYLIKLLSQTARPLRFWAWTPTPMDQGSGQINVYAAATSRILVEVDGGWSSSKIAYGSSVSFNIKITNLDTANVRANINASLIEVFEVFEEEVPQAAIMFDKTVIAIDPGESVIITLTVNVETLKPGTYAGYVVIYDGERYYRAPISVFVPFKAGGDGSVRANLGVLIGKSILLLEPKYDLWPDWNIIGIYVESPLKKPVAINVWNAHMGDPGRPTILLSTPDKATAALPFSGFIFNSPGLYIIIAGYYQLIYPDIIVGNAPMYLRVIVETLEVYEPVAVEEARELIDMVKALEERVSKLEDKIGILESRITALKTKVIELEGMFTVLIERLSGLRDRLEYINSTLSSIEIKISQSESDIKTLKANIRGLEARLRDISIDIDLIKNAVTILNDTLRIVKADIEEVTFNLRELKVSFEKNLTENRMLIETLSANVSSKFKIIEEDLGTIRGKIPLLESLIENVKGDLKDLESKLETVKSNLEKAKINLENMISVESERLGSKAFRAEILAVAGIAIGILATTLATYTLIRRK